MINDTALVILVLFGGALLSAPLAALLLWMFRRSLQRGMVANAVREIHAGSIADLTSMDVDARAGESLIIRLLDYSTRVERQPDLAGFVNRAEQSMRHSVLTYTLAGVAYALVFGVTWSLQFPEGLKDWHRIVGLAVQYLWPTVLAVALIAATTRRERLKLALFYFAFVALICAYLVAISPKLTVGQIALLWILTNGPATLLVLAFLRRRVRAVGPIVISFISAGVLGYWIAPSLLLRNERSIRTAVTIGSVVHLGGAGTFYTIGILGFLLFALVAWWLLRRFAEQYRKKKLSDQSLALDALFFVFAVEQSLALGSSRVHIYTGIAAFLAYKLTVRVLSRYFRLKPTDTTPPVLLHLRVFALGHRSEDLFDGVTKLWRRVGSVAMIAGPDLIRTTVEPHEFLEFLGGKMSRRFVSDDSDLSRRLAELDRQPDPDGRYRVNQFFCHRDTWQITMSTLARQSTAVLMDLRSFSQNNQGCMFELAQLIEFVDLHQVVFLIDVTTDRALLEETLQRLWRRIPAHSPNSLKPAPTARFFLDHSGKTRRTALLFRELLSPGTEDKAAA